MLLKLSLLNSKKEIAFFSLFLFSILSINLFLEYKNFKKVTEEDFYRDTFLVLSQYQKETSKKKKYFVLKLTNQNFTFYTTSYLKLPNLINREINLVLNSENIDFLNYLKGFYTYSFDYELMDKKEDLKDFLIEKISNAHNHYITKEFFLAIFLAIPSSKKLRDKVSILGISHLIAISGFHLGVLSFVLYFLLKFPYSFFHNRYFPYRNKKFDLTIIISIILLFYITLTNSPPSLIRAFLMMILGFYLYYKNFEILSFKTLFIVAVLILALFPRLFFSISLWFSIAGVFYIYLFLHHFKHLNKVAIFILIHFWVYFLMLPISHSIFDETSFYQLLSPIISMLFIIFYPLEIFLHIIGLGDLLDNFLIKFFSIEAKTFSLFTNLNFLVIYIIISLFAIRYRFFLIFLLFSLFFYIFKHLSIITF